MSRDIRTGKGAAEAVGAVGEAGATGWPAAVGVLIVERTSLLN